MTVEVERLARALGVWCDTAVDGWPRGPFPFRDLAVWRSSDGRIRICSEEKDRVVDPLTAALLLLGHARGLRVDVGECPACPTILQFSTREDARKWCSHGRGEFQKCIAAMPPAWSPRTPPEKGRRRWRGESRAWWGVWLGGHWATRGELACSGCTGDGRTTGRHTLPWEAAIIAAMPKRAEVRRNASDWGGLGQAMAAAGPVAFDSAGDASAREALAVMADEMMERGDAPGDLVTAWLRGGCSLCDGRGWLRGERGDVGAVRCRACDGHGSVLGAFEQQLAAMVVEQIEALTGRNDHATQGV